MAKLSSVASCPFCGHPGAVIRTRGSYYAYCTNDDCGAELVGKPTSEQAAAAWNARIFRFDHSAEAKP